MAVNAEPDARTRRHALRDLGWSVIREGDELRGVASVVPEMHVPGTTHLRTSILATWADTIAGYRAFEVLRPRVPVTLELDVHLYRPSPASGPVRGECRIAKAGRSVFVAEVDFSDGEDRPIGFAGVSFMAAPDESLTMNLEPGTGLEVPEGTRLQVPFAEHAGCERVEPGVARLVNSEESLNASNTVNGGLIALTAEEALVSLAPGATLSSLGLRYLQPVRVGPVLARAELEDGLGKAEVRDAGNEERLCVMVTGRTFPS